MEDSREFQPYRILAKEKGFNKAELERKYKRLRAELQAMKEESENALRELETFHAILLRGEPIDITKEKLVEK